MLKSRTNSTAILSAWHAEVRKEQRSSPFRRTCKRLRHPLTGESVKGTLLPVRAALQQERYTSIVRCDGHTLMFTRLNLHKERAGGVGPQWMTLMRERDDLSGVYGEPQIVLDPA